MYASIYIADVSHSAYGSGAMPSRVAGSLVTALSSASYGYKRCEVQVDRGSKCFPMELV